MKKIACLLLLFQGGIMMAQQKETVATINGKKIQVNPNAVDTADNGLTLTGENVQLGGALLKATALVTTSSATLALQGLQAGAANDNVLVVDENGVIKSILRASLGDNLGNHTATQNLEMSSKNISNINNAYVKNEVQILDRTSTNTNYFGLYKNNGSFSIWNSLKKSNDFTIDEATRKTTVDNLQVAKGIDGGLPEKGAVATAADDNGNIIWKKPDVKGILTSKLVGYAKVANGRGVSGTYVYFDGLEVNPENAFSGDYASGTTYTVKKAGLYQVFVNISTTTRSTGAWYARILRNGTAIAASDAGAGWSTTIFTVENLVVGDKITVDMERSLGYNANLTKLAVFRFEE